MNPNLTIEPERISSIREVLLTLQTKVSESLDLIEDAVLTEEESDLLDGIHIDLEILLTSIENLL